MKMKCTCLVLIGFLLAFGVNAQVKYGSNPAAGKYYEVNGIKLYCEIYGQGKPLLLIHGNSGSISSFHKNIPFFAAKYKVIAVDSRSQGKSADASDSLSFELMADDFAALLDQLHISSAYVLGWSDGGINALLLAMRHPEKVIALASTGANLWPDSTALLPSFWKNEAKHFREWKTKTNLSAAEKNQRKLFMLDWYQPNIKVKDLAKIQCPSLIIGGDRDLILAEHTVEIYRGIRNAYLWILPHSGHSTLIEHATEFNQKVDEFFSSSVSK